jgi:hypothetical protein
MFLFKKNVQFFCLNYMSWAQKVIRFCSHYFSTFLR